VLGSWRKLRSRLVYRIYVVGLLQFALVAFGMVVVARETHPGPAWEGHGMGRFVSLAISRDVDEGAPIAAELDRIHQTLRWSVAAYDENGRLLAATTPETPPESVTGHFLFSSHEGPFRSVPLSLPGGKVGRLDYLLPPPPGPPPSLVFPVLMVLAVVGISSWLTARSLARPLRRLSETAYAFGSGVLDARMRMKRYDELGEVALAFDEMADRVTGLLRAEKELLANVSHELRTPLARIHVAVDLASEGDVEMARESLGEIAEDLAELERIVDDVLSAARLSLRDGRATLGAVRPLRIERVDVGSLLRRSTAKFRSAYPTRRLNTVFPETGPVIMADGVLLRRVIDNLLDNAHKYTENPEQEISLSASSEFGSLHVEVRDQGVGMSAEDVERAFEPFFRADRSRARATGGLGLGLTLARRIIEAHGGTLRLVSSVGKGTCCRIQLPFQPAS
jgi:two-component system OmpR family sensor kinase